MLTGTNLVFGLLALVVIGTAIGMLVSRNAIYAALFLVLNFITVAFLYLVLGAPFIALTQVAVYAGSIMVLFLFVIMMLGAEKLPGKDMMPGFKTLSILLGIVLLAEIVIFTIYSNGSLGVVATPSVDFAGPAEVGRLLFSKYLLPFEMVAIILLSSTIGAIVLTRKEVNQPNEVSLGEKK
ncbi:MAG: NADH-quinone oxidoreductase subunit J [Anaerolineaceae bacterium]